LKIREILLGGPIKKEKEKKRGTQRGPEGEGARIIDPKGTHESEPAERKGFTKVKKRKEF